MGTLLWRADYAKFVVEVAPENWPSTYRAIQDAANLKKCAGDFKDHHRVNRWYYNAVSGMETWSIDIFGEWAGLVEHLPIKWVPCLRRYDVRAIVWDTNDEVILNIGTHLVRNITSWNIHLFHSKVAKKSDKRDRGGTGFAIGSHKSDLRSSVYKRHGEPAAMEHQMKGPMLQRIAHNVFCEFQGCAQTISPWWAIHQRVVEEGEKRLERTLQAAGIGTYWPTLGPEDLPSMQPAQAAFIPVLSDESQAQPLSE